MTAGSEPQRFDREHGGSGGTEAGSGSSAAGDLWWAVLARLPRTQDGSFSATLAAVQPVGVGHGTLRLRVPSAFHAERLASRHLAEIDESLRDVSPGKKVEIVVDHDGDAASPDQLSLELSEIDAGRPGAPEDALNPRYCFEAFVVGDSNRLPHAAAVSVAENDRTEYNPLFIHGESGNGKTHLLHAIGLHVRAAAPRLDVRYVTCERFMGEFVEGLRTRQLEAFTRRYRSCSMLLLDDVQFLEGKDGTQEEFFHTFNDVIAAGGRVVLAADRHPGGLATLPERLRSRFSGGLVANLDAPAFETRVSILRRKSESKGVDVPEEVLALLASAVTTNVRQLEGALNRVVAEASLDGRPLTLDSARQSVESFLGTAGRTLTLERIIQEAAEVFGFTVEDLRGYSRTRPLVSARQAATYVCRMLTEESLPAIGRAFGGRDHTTVLYSVRKVEQQMTNRTAVYEKVVELMNRLGGVPLAPHDGGRR